MTRRAIPKRIQRMVASAFSGQTRDPRYVFAAIIAALLFIFFTVQAETDAWLANVETPIFHWVNSLPSFLGPVMYLITQFGGLGFIVLWIAFAWKTISRRAAVLLTLSIALGWFVAKIVKVSVHRDRPGGFFDTVNFFHDLQYTGYGFPSGHSTVVAAAAASIYFYSKKRYRKYLVLTAFAVGISRMYLGAHLPLDVVGGWALGVLCASIINLVFGNHKKRVSPARIKQAMKSAGLEAKSVQTFQVDARGSVPIQVVLASGERYFGKLFGDQEHAADWLFKIYRFFRFKNLHGEDPFLSSKRNLELEALASVWATRGGIQTPKVIELIRIGSNWLLLQEMVQGRPLSDYTKVRTSTLSAIWKDVRRLHEANIAHRDLRAANILIDTTGKPWLIDFGFAEIAPTPRRKKLDIAELLMSMSLVAGVERTVDTAIKELGPEQLIDALPYVQKSVFSGATRSHLKQNKAALSELQQELQERLGLEDEEVDTVDIDRFSGRKIFNLILLTVFMYIIIPQFRQFQGFLESLDSLNWWLVPLAFAASLGTYAAAAFSCVSIAPVPIGSKRALLIQIASSFMSKILPGGVGGTALIAKFLTRSGLTKEQTSAVIVVQNVISTVSFIVPLGLVLIASGRSITDLTSVHVHVPLVVLLGVVVALVAAVVVLWRTRSLRERIGVFFRDIMGSFQEISNSPKELLSAFGFCLLITVFYILAVFISMHSFGLNASLLDATLIYATATIAKTAVPTPGGLGAVEIGMLTAMHGLGFVGSTTFAVVVLYRLVTFWLPIPFSYAAYRYIEKKRYV